MRYQPSKFITVLIGGIICININSVPMEGAIMLNHNCPESPYDCNFYKENLVCISPLKMTNFTSKCQNYSICIDGRICDALNKTTSLTPQTLNFDLYNTNLTKVNGNVGLICTFDDDAGTYTNISECYHNLNMTCAVLAQKHTKIKRECVLKSKYNGTITSQG